MLDFRRFKSCLAVASAATATGIFDDLPGITYPTARIETSYRPGSSRFRGKLYAPSLLLTTVTILLDPSRCAETSTPSIRPSSEDVTVPVKADCAAKGCAKMDSANRITPRNNARMDWTS